MKKKIGKAMQLITTICLAIIMTGCTANLLPKSLKNGEDNRTLEEKGNRLLESAWKAQGFDNLENHKTFQFTFTDYWKGMMGGMGKLWAQKKTRINQKGALKSFDSQIEFLDGKTKGLVAGIQSWKYYEMENGVANFNVKENERYIFGMTAFHYFTELIDRLKNAEFIRYAGEKKFNGKDYDLVYVTWKSLKKNKEVDQYILYLNKETKMLDYVTFTVRDSYLKMPGASMFYGSMQFSDYRNIDGFKFPFLQTVYLNKPKKKEKKYMHQLKVESFEFDSFEESDLYPNKSLKKLGDKKVTK